MSATAQQPTSDKLSQLQYFQLIGGPHYGVDENGKDRYYRQGELVPSSEDLAARWPEKFARLAPGPASPSETMPRPGETKDEYTARMQALIARNAATMDSPAPPAGPVTPPKTQTAQPMVVGPEVLNAMTEKELRGMAAENGIGLEGCKGKADIVKTIQAHLADE